MFVRFGSNSFLFRSQCIFFLSLSLSLSLALSRSIFLSLDFVLLRIPMLNKSVNGAFFIQSVKLNQYAIFAGFVESLVQSKNISVAWNDQFNHRHYFGTYFQKGVFLLFSLEIKPFPDDSNQFFPVHIRSLLIKSSAIFAYHIDELLLRNPFLSVFCNHHCFVLTFGRGKFNIFVLCEIKSNVRIQTEHTPQYNLFVAKTAIQK